MIEMTTKEASVAPPQMEEGVFYDLNPSAAVKGERFSRVQCEYRVPNNPNEYVVKGIPDGGTRKKSFVLRFTKGGRVRHFRSSNQSDIRLV